MKATSGTGGTRRGGGSPAIPSERGAANFAGSGRTPVQDVIPAHLAAEFLSADGETWSPWREMEEGKADPNTRIFTIRERFARPTATIALHLPYTVAYQEAFLQRLRAGKYPGVAVDEVGESAEGRKLYMVRVDDPECPTPLRLGETITRQDGTVVPVVRIEDAPGAAEAAGAAGQCARTRQRARRELGGAGGAAPPAGGHPGEPPPAQEHHLAAAADLRSGWRGEIDFQCRHRPLFPARQPPEIRQQYAGGGGGLCPLPARLREQRAHAGLRRLLLRVRVQ